MSSFFPSFFPSFFHCDTYKKKDERSEVMATNASEDAERNKKIKK